MKRKEIKLKEAYIENKMTVKANAAKDKNKEI